MPFKLLGTVVLLLVVTIFAGFNIDNKCNVNLIFRQFDNVPIFFSLMAAFVVGVVIMIPFTLGKRRTTESKPVEEKKSAAEIRAEKKAEKIAAKKNKKIEAIDDSLKAAESLKNTSEKDSTNSENADTVIPV